MSGEHTHPELYDVAASLRADLLAAAARLAALDAAMGRMAAHVTTLEAEQAELVEGMAAMATWSDYSGKPAGTLLVKAGEYVRVDVDVADPPRSGAAEFHMLYANCILSWMTGQSDGVIRVKYVREDGDDTGYQDYLVTKAGVMGSPGSFLLTASHFEVGQAGLGGRWWIRCGGGLASITVGTRYCKVIQVG